MEFRVLGPVEMWSADRRVEAGHAKQRAVLAVLLLDLGKVVPIDVLIDRVWGDGPPASVRNNLYAYVARLRSGIAGAGDNAVTLSRRPGGYVLQADPNQVDLSAFRRRVRLAAAADDQDATGLLDEALALWRGPALAGLTSPWLDSMRGALEQQRIAALLDRGDIALRQGQHAALTSTLAEQAVARPADERLIGQLMTALYRSGRPAEALRWFEQTRRHLAEELGADPGPALKTLHQQILRTDPALAGPVPTVPGTGALAPRELPADVRAFTGRSAELAELDRMLSGAATEPAAVVISALSGTAGVGKTALAVHWAHRVAGGFPGGQLYVNLRGYDPGQPMTPADALAAFLRSLGVPGQDIPVDPDERAARYRSMVSGRRILVLLDNASGVEQVRPLLPGTATCIAVVTSRDSLAGLVARDGAARLDLDLLPRGDAVALLRQLIGARASTEPSATDDLAELCCRLPLALRIAAELAASRPAVPLSSLAAELTDRQRRLDLLTAGDDPRTAVRAVFSWSYRNLDRDAAHAFRLASLHPGRDLDLYALAALAGSTVEQARQVMDVLARAHLIQMVANGRCGMHDLLRGYARGLTATHDGEQQERAALTRLFDHYLYTAAAAMDGLYPEEKNRRPRISPPDSPVPPINDERPARTWLDDERDNLAAIAAYTAQHGWPTYTTRLAATLFRYLYYGGYYHEARVIHGQARSAARLAGDRSAEATALIDLGGTDWRQARHQQAIDHFRRALKLFGEAGDLPGQARAHGSIGVVDHDQGRYQQAAEHHRQALKLHRLTGELAGQATALNNLGIIEELQGRYKRAASYCEQAIAAFREIGHRAGEAMALDNLGAAVRKLGHYEKAAQYHLQALTLYRQSGDRTGEAWALNNLGSIDEAQGRYEQAAYHHEQALDLYRETGDLGGESEALNDLGVALTALGRTKEALGYHTRALSIASQTGSTRQQARAHYGLGDAHHRQGNPAPAREHWQHALALFTQLGSPDAAKVRAALDRTIDISDNDPRRG